MLTALATSVIMSNRAFVCKLLRLRRTFSDYDDDNNTTIASANSADKPYGLFKYATNEKGYKTNVHNEYEITSRLCPTPYSASVSDDIPSIHQDAYHDKLNITENPDEKQNKV